MVGVEALLENGDLWRRSGWGKVGEEQLAVELGLVEGGQPGRGFLGVGCFDCGVVEVVEWKWAIAANGEWTLRRVAFVVIAGFAEDEGVVGERGVRGEPRGWLEAQLEGEAVFLSFHLISGAREEREVVEIDELVLQEFLLLVGVRLVELRASALHLLQDFLERLLRTCLTPPSLLPEWFITATSDT